MVLLLLEPIADELNAAGFTTVRNKPHSEKSLWHILHNRSYIGEYKWGDIVIPDGLPRLVSDDVFNRCQEILEKTSMEGEAAHVSLIQIHL